MENTCLEDPRDVRPACQGIAPISVVQFCPVGHTTRDVPGSAPLPQEHLKIQIFLYNILFRKYECYGNTGCGVFKRGNKKLERFLPKN